MAPVRMLVWPCCRRKEDGMSEGEGLEVGNGVGNQYGSHGF